ncbi:MAG: T9SS type A sorting domain-containing protein, partial [Candidatus Azobacteroides sp.]|nr:T9SS type A sorting domain-containing protein [Candidatus Azobacteroides sp.]
SSSKYRTHTFYVDGVNVGTINNANAFESVTGGFRVGAHKTGNRSFWSGTIDELYLFEGALTEEQINMVKDNRADDIFKTNRLDLQQKDKTILYPNPIVNFLNFTQTVDKVKIIDLSGQVVFEQNTPAQSVNLAQLAPGAYIVLTQRASNIFMNKLIKQ